MNPATNQPALKPFYQTRWSCHRCGFFESWTINPLASCLCPNLKCRQPAYQMPGEACKGMTARLLPFFTRPRGAAKSFEAEYTFSENATRFQRRRRN